MPEQRIFPWGRLERREPHDLLEPLLAGQLDVVFSFERALDDFKQADALEHVPIVQAQAVLVVRDSHPLAVPGACAQDFQDVPCFISEQMTPPTQKRLSFEAEWSAYGIRFSDVHIVPNRESMQTMVEMGRGVTISTNVDRFPTFPHLRSYSINRVQTVDCIWRKGESRPQMRAFLQAVLENSYRC